MQHSFENIPNHIFEQIEKQNFDRLTNEEKREVLVYFSQEEYNELRQASLDIKSAGIPRPEMEQLKKAALAFYDSRHSQKIKPAPLLLWQAAAVVLLLLCGWLFYMWSKTGIQKTSLPVAVHDTIYVQQPQLINTVHDTLTVIRTSKLNTSDMQVPQADAKPVSAPANGSVEILTLEEHRKISASAPGNCMKNDSLLRKFGFVSL